MVKKNEHLPAHIQIHCQFHLIPHNSLLEKKYFERQKNHIFEY